jgi:hypothetical protein
VCVLSGDGILNEALVQFAQLMEPPENERVQGTAMEPMFLGMYM